MASPEAETFLWRRILLDERVSLKNQSRALLRLIANPAFTSFRLTAQERFYATIFVKRLF
jgi:hypothetical protein